MFDWLVGWLLFGTEPVVESPGMMWVLFGGNLAGDAVGIGRYEYGTGRLIGWHRLASVWFGLV